MRRNYVIHKENGGISSARNAAMEIAHGDYIGFVDSDDTIEPIMYERLYEKISSLNCKIVACAYRAIEENGSLCKKKYDNIPALLSGVYSVYRKLLK